ncbi:MAG: D-2-hydroxyacid dehydrogenase [SAR202 cluster bacterium]|jgi:phosphoglycerate dehydrogenase-like enzyme|nr:D-2-hydroxyacid dehydrogenase [SAR202 cluster bacterium]MDP6300392.1 D-2-hydroxyacid dehydrogenase [SAR202 cluster bacterium]MDP7103154.1 D-2-hydroxyacid dehydrogenase [SAR202 cluster bacterium]MDP7224717.1 D-2-hydroxyacid dehydrogenase [SAR202 cluster bacterium]MDP7413989.1 D-2-hydroxyacid dehydrogenase [SAR202 cluster bacterium]|tara:strand:- start:1200 stop:2171 length:972 start_codon:yes stop_codon:yes gene_type:complete
MAFNLLIVRGPASAGQSAIDAWPAELRAAIPGITVNVATSEGEAMEMIGEADAAFGDIRPELLARGEKLRWIACPQAGPPAGYYHGELVDSDVVVTNTREIYNDHISNHIMSFVLSFARGLHVYVQQQMRGDWAPGYEIVNLPDATAIIVGVGGIGAETARLCSEFGMNVLGIDPRVTDPPQGVAELHNSEALGELLPRADFVIATAPETPATQGMFNADLFGRMNPGAHFINIGRGATVILDDLVDALTSGKIRGAALDVFQVEPLPSNHALWSMPNVIITPHCAGAGPYLDDRRLELFIDNCTRFNEGQTLLNVVDKANWF